VRQLLVKEITAVRGVSPQQARTDLKRFRREDVLEIKQALEKLVPKERLRISLRQVASIGCASGTIRDREEVTKKG
jgi:hypothetical protein